MWPNQPTWIQLVNILFTSVSFIFNSKCLFLILLCFVFFFFWWLQVFPFFCLFFVSFISHNHYGHIFSTFIFQFIYDYKTHWVWNNNNGGKMNSKEGLIVFYTNLFYKYFFFVLLLLSSFLIHFFDQTNMKSFMIFLSHQKLWPCLNIFPSCVCVSLLKKGGKYQNQSIRLLFYKVHSKIMKMCMN